jgi:hypothetical protein
MIKTKEIDLIEVVANGIVQVREATVSCNENNTIVKTYERWCLFPDQDISNQDESVKAVCRSAWTESVIADYKLMNLDA